MKYTDKIIIDINTNLQGKEIHFLAYSYENDSNYVLVEYCGFYASLADVIKSTNDGTLVEKLKEYEGRFGEMYKQYCQDCTGEELEAAYTHYDNGKSPIFTDTLYEDTPDGVYAI